MSERYQAGTRMRHELLLACLSTGWLLCGAGTASAADLTDPTRPPDLHQSAVQRAQVTERQEFAVSAIKISDASKRALVNGQLVSEGDQIGDARVIKISQDGVLLEYLAEENRITLLPQTVRLTNVPATN